MIDSPQPALREQLRADFQAARTELAEIVAASDPMGLGGDPAEYDLEVELVMPRLRHARSVADVPPILHEIFTHSLGAPPPEDLARYDDLAARIWAAWRRYPLIHDPHYKLEP